VDSGREIYEFKGKHMFKDVSNQVEGYSNADTVVV
jgi:hypothetical protein